MPIWKYLHIVAMFASVTLLAGGDVYFHVLRGTGDLRSLRRFLRAINPIFAAGVVLLTLGVVFGLLTAASDGFSLTATWLIAAYVLVAVLYLIGLVVGLPYYRGVATVLARDEETPSADTRQALESARGVGSMAASVVLYAVIILLMVVKPFA